MSGDQIRLPSVDRLGKQLSGTIADLPSRRSWLANPLVVAAAALALVAFAFTPPGRAATGWIADLAGFGEEPSLEQTGSVPGRAVVLTSGTLSDGTPYEVVAKQTLFGRGPDTAQPNDARPAYLCTQVDFPSATRMGQGGHCTDGEENGSGIGYESAAFIQEPTADGADVKDDNSPGVFVGFAELPETGNVEVEILRDGGEMATIPSELIKVEGNLLNQVGTDTPIGVFVANVDEATVREGRRGELEVRATAKDSDGSEIGHVDATFPIDCSGSENAPTVDLNHPPRPGGPGYNEYLCRSLEEGLR
jgi:hypothetical protein